MNEAGEVSVAEERRAEAVVSLTDDEHPAVKGPVGHRWLEYAGDLVFQPRQ